MYHHFNINLKNLNEFISSTIKKLYQSLKFKLVIITSVGARVFM